MILKTDRDIVAAVILLLVYLGPRIERLRYDSR